MITAMIPFQQHLVTCTGSFTQAGATYAFSQDYSPDVQAMWKDWEKRCEFVSSEIDAIPGLSCRMPEGAFYAWIDIRQTQETSDAFTERLLKEQQVALVPGAAFGASGEGYVRMTCVKSWEDIREGVMRIRAGVS
jgi:aminotransferase